MYSINRLNCGAHDISIAVALCVHVCLCVCVHVRMYALRAAGGGRQFTGCGGRTAASALDGGHRASGRRVTHDWRRWVDGGLQVRLAVSRENIAFHRSEVCWPL